MSKNSRQDIVAELRRTGTKPDPGGFYRAPGMRLFGDAIIHGLVPLVVTDATRGEASAFLSGLSFMAAAAAADPLLAAKIVKIADGKPMMGKLAAADLNQLVEIAADPALAALLKATDEAEGGGVTVLTDDGTVN